MSGWFVCHIDFFVPLGQYGLSQVMNTVNSFFIQIIYRVSRSQRLQKKLFENNIAQTEHANGRLSAFKLIHFFFFH